MAAFSDSGTVASDLTSAAMWGDKELLESLLKTGADPNFPNHQGNSALHEAAYYGELECASILLDHKGVVLIVQLWVFTMSLAPEMHTIAGSKDACTCSLFVECTHT